MASGNKPELDLAQITLLCAIFSVPLYCNLGIGFKGKSILVRGKPQWWSQFYTQLVFKPNFGTIILWVFFPTFCGQKLKNPSKKVA